MRCRRIQLERERWRRPHDVASPPLRHPPCASSDRRPAYPLGARCLVDLGRADRSLQAAGHADVQDENPAASERDAGPPADVPHAPGVVTASFQSPTSRGGLCNASQQAAAAFVGAGFNPLLRGAAFATTAGSAPVGSIGRFQSPTSRGGLCNLMPGPGIKRSLRSFQSPTSRGGLCNKPAEAGRFPSWILSFNPLLRGAAFATSRGASGISDKDRFQSPTSRGGLCNRKPVIACASPGWTFQSPTSRGGLCNCHFELGRPFLASPHEALRRRFVVGLELGGGWSTPPPGGRF